MDPNKWHTYILYHSHFVIFSLISWEVPEFLLESALHVSEESKLKIFFSDMLSLKRVDPSEEAAVVGSSSVNEAIYLQDKNVNLKADPKPDAFDNTGLCIVFHGV